MPRTSSIHYFRGRNDSVVEHARVPGRETNGTEETPRPGDVGGIETWGTTACHTGYCMRGGGVLHGHLSVWLAGLG